MSYPPRSRPGQLPRAESHRWTARKSGPVPRVECPSRRYEAMALLPGEGVVEVNRVAPAHPIFESAFAALARGTILATRDGPVAVEDLLPGIEIETRDAGFQPLLWIGSITLMPQGAPGLPPSRLFRVPADSFGPSRPMPDLVLAPHARLLHRSPRLAHLSDDASALAPITAFEDGASVIRVAPVSPVKVYHLAFREHHVLRANGIEIESFHPGLDLSRKLSEDSLRLFLSLFPQVDGLSGFGPLRALRLSTEELQSLDAA